MAKGKEAQYDFEGMELLTEEVTLTDSSGNTGTLSASNVGRQVYTAELADISTASTIYFSIGFAGTVEIVYSVIDGAIATSDATLDVKNAADASMGTITVAFSGSAAGDQDSLSPSSNNTVAAGDVIKVETDGASTNTVKAFITVIVTNT